MNRWSALLNDETGAALPEYALVLALFSVLAMASLSAIAVAAETALEAGYANFEQLQETPPL
ncbi:MAG: hypothetical protein ABI182_02230 [Candidatus Baltobacteraceae bacterium]